MSSVPFSGFQASHGYSEQVIRQLPFGPRPKTVFFFVPVVLLICVGMFALLATGGADGLRFRGLPVRHVISVLLPLLTMLMSALLIMLGVSKAWPAHVTLTNLGLYFPKNSLNRTLVFVPFSDRPAMHVDTVEFWFVTAADIRLNGPRGKYAISKSMLPSDAEFYELAELLKARLPFT